MAGTCLPVTATYLGRVSRDGPRPGHGAGTTAVPQTWSVSTQGLRMITSMSFYKWQQDQEDGLGTVTVQRLMSGPGQMEAQNTRTHTGMQGNQMGEAEKTVP